MSNENEPSWDMGCGHFDSLGDPNHDCSNWDKKPVEGDIAIVTRRSGKKYVGIYTLAPGIDYFWRQVIPGKRKRNQITDPDVSYEVIGHIT